MLRHVVRVYCNYICKVILCYFTFIFDLELMTLQKGKNAGIRPLFGQNKRLGVSYSGVSLYLDSSEGKPWLHGIAVKVQ